MRFFHLPALRKHRGGIWIIREPHGRGGGGGGDAEEVIFELGFEG